MCFEYAELPVGVLVWEVRRYYLHSQFCELQCNNFWALQARMSNNKKYRVRYRFPGREREVGRTRTGQADVEGTVGQ